MAAMARWVSDTIRTDVTLILAPAGDDQSTSRVRARAQVHDPLVRVQRAVPDVERLVVHQQPDDLAVGDVDDRLPVVGEAVPRLRVRQRPDLVHRVQVAARQPVRVTLVEVAAQPEVPVGQGEDGLALGQQVEVEFLLDQTPGLGSVRRLLDHQASLSRSSARSLTTMSAPCLDSSSAWPPRSTPTTSAK